MMRGVKPISGYQFAAFRIALGLYLVQHFLLLIPWAPELFSRDGLLPDATLNFTHGVLPNPLEWWDTPAVATGFVVVMLVLSIALTLGVFRRTACLLLWYGWACLFGRNNLISNPSIPYIGLIFLLMTLVPLGEPLALRRRRDAGDAGHWHFPWMIFFAAWAVMAVGYTFSGLDKLLNSPSWQDGTAILHLVHNPLARPGPLRDLFLLLPEWVHKGMTWSALGLEVLFLPLCLHRWTRLFAWAAMLGMHLGILAVVDFADLTFGMVMVHLFTFDPAWFPARRTKRGRSVVFFDGVCALCHGTMTRLIDEDRERILHFAPLQGESFAALREAVTLPASLDSVIYVRDHGTDEPRVFVRSDAILQIARDLGGFWRVVSWARIIPRPLRNWLYDGIAAHRYRWFGQYEACRLPTPQEREQLLP